MDDLTEIKQRLDNLEMARIHQSDIPPYTIKQRHLASNISLSEVFISDPVTSTMSITGQVFGNFSPSLSITFTPTFSKKYIIFGNLRASVSAVDCRAFYRIYNTSGSAIIDVNQESAIYNIPSDTGSFSMYIYTIVTLVKDIEYTFTLQGKSDYVDSIARINPGDLTNGVYLIAQSL